MKRRITVFALVLAILASGIFAPFGGCQAAAESVYEVKYPECARKPEQSAYYRKNGEFDSDSYDSAYDLWAMEHMKRRLMFAQAEEFQPYAFSISREILALENGENKVFSPVNVYLALSMLAEITDADTRREVLDLLHAESMEELRLLAEAVFLSVYENDGQTTSIPASSVWLRSDMMYKPDALQKLSEKHYASSFTGEMGTEEYNETIRKWLNDHTGGLLEELAKNISFDADTIIALATSLYFKAGWENEFSESGTETKPFHANDGDMPAEFMHKRSSDTYYRGENFGAVALELTNGGNMWIFLPDEGVSPESLFVTEEPYTLTLNSGLWPDQKRLIVNKAVPKFDVTGDNDLIESLQKLGVRSAFDDNLSDFTPLTDLKEIAVNKISHNARVKIDEKGVEAAAYTVLMAYATSARPPEEEMDFIVDRPFAFIITSTDNLPLFAGIVNRPAE